MHYKVIVSYQKILWGGMNGEFFTNIEGEQKYCFKMEAFVQIYQKYTICRDFEIGSLPYKATVLPARNKFFTTHQLIPSSLEANKGLFSAISSRFKIFNS